MSWADAANGAFEVLGGVFVLLSVFKTHRDKMVRGVSWPTTVFFMSWGYWNLYFYPSLDQWLSFAGGVFLVAANTVWVVQLAYYLMKEKRSLS